MTNDRLKLSNNEKLAQTAFGLDGTMMAMNEVNMDDLLDKENTRRFNNEFESVQEQLEANNEKFKEAQESLMYDAEAAEIKPLFTRILIKPFKVNPFQKLTQTESGLIVDSGGYNPHLQRNSMTGQYEEQEEFIQTGEVIEVGPECKYVQPGDAVYYRKDTIVPVPFLKAGLYTIAENQLLAVVGLNLTERFNNGK